uniref:Zinc finger, CCHC-type n=1 Tax=Tanacetum cinerariifolium TaxID=118510 RepID=A0A6L2N8B8_TANCI|nr:zinc finger, CCHC-type [Tanacetum cinerariifolium]
MDEGTKILATVDGKLRTISESSIRRNLKLNDEERISTLPDAENFENLALMGPSFLGRTVPLFDSMLVTPGEGSGTLTEPHHTPSPEAQQSPHTAPSSPSLPPATTEPIPAVTPSEIPTLRQYSRRARIAQSSALPTTDRENIIKTSALPHDLTPRVTSFAADEDNMQQKLYELTNLCTHLQRQHTEMATKIAAQDLEIFNLKAMIKMLKDKDGGGAEPSGEDATIKGRSLETGEEEAIEKSTERGSNDTEELINVLTSMDAVTILTSGVQVVSVPSITEIPTVDVPNGSGLVPTASLIFTTASVVTPYSRRKGKEKMVESDTPKKKKLQEQIDVQMLIDGLDRNNKVIASHLHEYEEAAAELTIGEKIELINKPVKYQDHHAKILKYQAQQSKPLSKKQQREFYMSIEDFVPMASKEEGERMKRKGLRLEHESAKKMKTLEKVSKEDLKEMMQLMPVEEVYVEALQVKHPIIGWEIHSEGQRNYWKIISDEVPTAIEERFPLLSKRDAPAEEVCTAREVKEDENPPRTLGDYSRLSHEGYQNTIEFPEGNNVVPSRFDSIRLVQNGCEFHGFRSEDPNQHLKDFLKLMDSIDLNDIKKVRDCIYFNFFFAIKLAIALNVLSRDPSPLGGISIPVSLLSSSHREEL